MNVPVSTEYMGSMMNVSNFYTVHTEVMQIYAFCMIIAYIHYITNMQKFPDISPR